MVGDPVFEHWIQAVNNINAAVGPSSSAKGEILEPVARSILRQFNGWKVSELPFVKPIPNLPSWCKETTLHINEIKKSLDDLDFLTSRPPSIGLIPHPHTRPDFLWYISQLCIICTILFTINAGFLLHNLVQL